MSRDFNLSDLTLAFPLPWSHYVRILAVKNAEARSFYEAEALRGGWSFRQLDRQIASLYLLFKSGWRIGLPLFR